MAKVVVVAGRRGAFDVVHRLGEVVDAERDGCHEQRQDLAQAADDLGSWNGQVDAELGEGIADGLGIHAGPRAAQVGDPTDRGTDHDREQSAGHAAGHPDAGRPAEQDDGQDRQRDPGHLEHLEGGAHGDERDRDPGQRPEHRRAGGEPPDRRADEGSDEDDHADDERPGQASHPGLERGPTAQDDRQHDHEGDEEVVWNARPVRHRRDVLATRLLR